MSSRIKKNYKQHIYEKKEMRNEKETEQETERKKMIAGDSRSKKR